MTLYNKKFKTHGYFLGYLLPENISQNERIVLHSQNSDELHITNDTYVIMSDI